MGMQVRRARSAATIIAAGVSAVTLLATVPSAASSRAQLSPRSAYVYVRTNATVFHDVTSVSLGALNGVGVTSPSIHITPPIVKNGQPAYRGRSFGRVVPASFFWGGEYCPYCAATRWGLIVALSRFGSFNKLFDMSSSAADSYPKTPTFTFFMTQYRSRFLVFHGYEIEGPTQGEPHMKAPPSVHALVKKYEPQAYFPFADFGNKILISGSAFNPGVLHGLTRDQIAARLDNPHVAVTKAILAEANYYSAGICSLDGNVPVKVCTSRGVEAGSRALGLKG